MIKRLLDKGYLTAAQARAVEVFFIMLVCSLATGLLDNVEIMVNGWEVKRKAFILMFATTTVWAIIAWVKKYLRDLQAELIDNEKI